MLNVPDPPFCEILQKAMLITGISDSSALKKKKKKLLYFQALGKFHTTRTVNLNMANLVISLITGSLCNAVFFFFLLQNNNYPF